MAFGGWPQKVRLKGENKNVIFLNLPQSGTDAGLLFYSSLEQGQTTVFVRNVFCLSTGVHMVRAAAFIDRRTEWTAVDSAAV